MRRHLRNWTENRGWFLQALLFRSLLGVDLVLPGLAVDLAGPHWREAAHRRVGQAQVVAVQAVAVHPEPSLEEGLLADQGLEDLLLGALLLVEQVQELAGVPELEAQVLEEQGPQEQNPPYYPVALLAAHQVPEQPKKARHLLSRQTGKSCIEPFGLAGQSIHAAQQTGLNNADRLRSSIRFHVALLIFHTHYRIFDKIRPA